MSTSRTFDALRRANPRTEPGFERSVREADALRARIVGSAAVEPDDARTVAARPRRSTPIGRAGLRAGAASLVAAAAVTAFVLVGLPGGGGVESASAAINDAAAATASSGSDSGTVTVVMTHDGELWVQKTVRWNDGDVAIVEHVPDWQERGRELRVVDGMMYGQDPDFGWVELGSPDSIDPESGTTPDEHLAATRADVSGDTLRRISDAMSDPTTQHRADGSTVYRGTVAAGLVAPEAGFKEGQHIRVFPFGYVAHDEAADPAAPVDVAITVGADGLIRELAVGWGTAGSAWTYTVTYRDLGTTDPIDAPANAKPFPRGTPVPPPSD